MSEPEPTIRSTTAVVGGVVALTLLLAGVLWRRPEVAALGVAPALVVFWDLSQRPRQRARLDVRAAAAGGAGQLRVVAEIVAPQSLPAARVRVSTHGYRTVHARVRVEGRREVRMTAVTARTGVHEGFRVDGIAESAQGLLVQLPIAAGPVRFTLDPLPARLADAPLPTRLDGITGPHLSRRIGDGTELYDVNEFRPGDRLRRIDWRVSARRGLDQRTGQFADLYVRRTLSTADATLMIVIDSRDELSADVSAWSGSWQRRMDEPTSLDIAREAAISLARHYLSLGDRVGFDDLGRRQHPVMPSGGRRHLERIRRRVLTARPEGWPDRRVRAPHVPTGALVVMCSTFLDGEAAQMIDQWRGMGHRVVAVDTLPAPDARYLDPYEVVAWRLVMLDRRARIEHLQRVGAELVTWADRPDLDLLVHARRQVRR